MTGKKVSMDVTALPESITCSICDEEESDLVGWWGNPFFGVALYQCGECRFIEMHWVRDLQMKYKDDLKSFYNDGSPVPTEEVSSDEGS